MPQNRKLSHRDLEILRQNGISPSSKLVREDRPSQAEPKGRRWIEEVAKLRQEVRRIDKRVRSLGGEIAALEKSRGASGLMTGAEQKLRAERNKAGKLRFKLEHKADRLEHSRARRADLRFDSAAGVRRVVSGGLPSSKR